VQTAVYALGISEVLQSEDLGRKGAPEGKNASKMLALSGINHSIT
jgi:hypothetical protein